MIHFSISTAYYHFGPFCSTSQIRHETNIQVVFSMGRLLNFPNQGILKKRQDKAKCFENFNTHRDLCVLIMETLILMIRTEKKLLLVSFWHSNGKPPTHLTKTNK